MPDDNTKKRSTPQLGILQHAPECKLFEPTMAEPLFAALHEVIRSCRAAPAGIGEAATQVRIASDDTVAGLTHTQQALVHCRGTSTSISAAISSLQAAVKAAQQ